MHKFWSRSFYVYLFICKLKAGRVFGLRTLSILDRVKFADCILYHSFKANDETATSLDPVVNCSVNIWNIVVLSISNTKITVPSRPLKDRHKILVLQVNLKRELSPSILDLNLLLSRLEALNFRYAIEPTLPASLINFPLERQNEYNPVELKSYFWIKLFVFNQF